MAQELKKAKIKVTNNEIEVYKNKLRGTWVDFADCKTEYYTNQLDFN